METIEGQRVPYRAWAVGVLGLWLTAVGCWHVVSTPATYWAQANVVILTPTPPGGVNTFQVTQTDAITMASVVQRELAGHASTRVAADDVSIVGQGLREGSWIRLVNNGGQWANNFDQPVLDVQAVGRTRQDAAQQMTAALNGVERALLRRQQAAGTAEERRYTATVSPPNVAINVSRGYRGRALAAMVLLGGGATAGLLSRSRSRTSLLSRAGPG